MTTYIEEVTRLRAENAELRARLADLNDAYDAGVQGLVRRLGMSVYQARLLAALATGRIMTRDQLERRCSRIENIDPRHVDNQVKRIRRKAIPGITIKSVYGAGYIVEGEALKIIRDAMRADT